MDLRDNNSAKIRLSDGRYLAYKERGVPKEKSNYRIIFVHGFDGRKERDFLAPQEVMKKMGIYIVQYDRAGYGESDPNPKRSLRSEASDIEELADNLHLGSKFYIICSSMGCYPTWSCIKHTPHRLAGVAFVVPIVNYQWPSLPHNLTKDDQRKKDYWWMTMTAKYVPKLLQWWAIRKTSSTKDPKTTYFTSKDLEIIKNIPGFQGFSPEKLRKRSIFNNLCSDLVVAFSRWDFDPLVLSNPFPENGQSCVHIWQGSEDKVTNLKLQRHIAERLPWIQYHEVPNNGHLLIYDTTVCEAILRSLLIGETPPSYSTNS
ncbi:PREDICTED: uncharacterized protein LOC109209878 [Nicotiana attenuata]|uniref:AB hydrolase-1 domain-containing protein n=1 Tax=Nicotiana attenuata TaxID=49451 RepID=A0A1J6J8Y8_NICAT|nr:PREDICTED: uncharacterized protein LOC109209878 [Nicotiana attenuata]OIT06271.1 hypothetical protein A4A49_39104 [Nicotiana attenuata]